MSEKAPYLKKIKIKTFDDYTQTVIDNDQEVENPYYPDYTYFADDDLNSLQNPRAFIIHSMWVPAEKSPTGEISTDPYHAKNLLESLGVSTHYTVPEREVEIEDGEEKLVVYQMTQKNRKTHHAGQSVLPNLKEDEAAIGLNHIALSMELLRKPGEPFTEEHYESAVGIIALHIIQGDPIEDILGHYEVAGDNVRGEGKGKTDPEGFEWDRFMGMLAVALGVSLIEVARYRSRVS